MCEKVEWEPVLPKPSGDLPCNALPFGILQDVCRSLDVYSGLDEGWRKVADFFSMPDYQPRSMDVSLSRISYIREQSIHNRCPTVLFLESLWQEDKVTVEEFLNAVKATKSFNVVCRRLESYIAGKISEAECNHSLLSSTLMVDTRKVRTLFHAIPPPSVSYLERTEVVAEIFNLFEQRREDVKLCTVVAEGDPGLGKSQIARQVGQRFIDHYASRWQDVAVCTVMAGSQDELLESYKNLAGILGLNVENLLETSTTKDQMLSVLFDRVGSTLSEYPNWLLIVDNLMNHIDSNEGQTIYPYIPYTSKVTVANAWSRGCVLLTIQLRGEFTDLDLTVFGQEQIRPSFSEAKQLVANILEVGIPEDDETLQWIVEALGYNSLALVSMAIAINFTPANKRKYKWTDYQTELREFKGVDVKRKGSESITVSKSVCLALGRLSKRKVLQLVFVAMSFLQYKSVPLALIEEFVKVKLDQSRVMVTRELKRLSSTLDQYPLISRSTALSSSSSKTVVLCHVHQVTHLVLQTDVVEQWGVKLSFAFSLFRAALVCEEKLSKDEETKWELPYLVPQLYALGQNGIDLYSEANKRGVGCKDDPLSEEQDWRDLPEVLYKATSHASLVLQSVETCLHFTEKCLETSAPLERKIEYLSSQGDILETKGQKLVAIKIGRNALMLAKLMHSFEPNPKLVANAVLRQRVRPIYRDGIELYRQHWEYFVCKGSYGARSREYAIMLFYYADVVKRIDRAEARACLEESIDILRALDDQHTLGAALCFYGRFLLTSWSSTDLQVALETARECVAVAERVSGKTSLNYIDRNLTLGRALMVNLRPREAIEHLQSSFQQMKTLGRAGQLFNYQLILSMGCVMSGQFAECRRYLERNVEILDSKDIDSPSLTKTSVRVGLWLLRGVDCLIRRPLSWLCSWRRRRDHS